MSSKWHGGKGDAQRKVDKQRFDANWDKIFGKKEKPDARKEKEAVR